MTPIDAAKLKVVLVRTRRNTWNLELQRSFIVTYEVSLQYSYVRRSSISSSAKLGTDKLTQRFRLSFARRITAWSTDRVI